MRFDPFRDPRAHPPGAGLGGRKYPEGDPYADPYYTPFDREKFLASPLRLRESTEERLGEILLRLGRLGPRQLDRALVLQRLEGLRLGETLVKLGIIDFPTLEEALLIQQGETLRPLDVGDFPPID